MRLSKTYSCSDCNKEEYWTRDDIYDGDYPPFSECRYCEQWVCDECFKQHLRDELGDFYKGVKNAKRT